VTELHAAAVDEIPVRGTSTDDPSGKEAAQAAHDAGAVSPPEPVQTFDVTLSCTVIGSRTTAEYVGAFLEQHAQRCGPPVRESVLTVAERVTE
jgi:hypothetical protein